MTDAEIEAVAVRPVRVQLSRKRGWRVPPNTVKVARPSKWGNPFPVGPDCDRAEAVRRFRYLLNSFDGPTWRHQIHELRGKNLACWCPLDQPCHADVLLELANADDVPPAPADPFAEWIAPFVGDGKDD